MLAVLLLTRRTWAWQVLEEQLARRGSAVAALRPALVRTLADMQHRLTFRAQAFIRARCTLLSPVSLGDLSRPPSGPDSSQEFFLWATRSDCWKLSAKAA